MRRCHALAWTFAARTTAACWLFAVAIAAMPSTCAAQRTDASKADVTKEALSKTSWYDPARGSLRPVEVETEIDDTAHRDSRWLPQPDRIAKKDDPATPAGGGGSGGIFGSGLSLGNLIGWGVLLLILVLVVGLLVYAFAKIETEMERSSSAGRAGSQAVMDEQMVERAKHLPPELRRTDVDLRSEAARLMRQGAYDQAVILLFGHQLLILDRAAVLRLNRGKTNGRYIRESRAADHELGERLAATVDAFERSYFGRHAISPEEFHTLWRNNATMEQRLEARREAVA